MVIACIAFIAGFLIRHLFSNRKEIYSIIDDVSRALGQMNHLRDHPNVMVMESKTRREIVSKVSYLLSKYQKPKDKKYIRLYKMNSK